MRTKTIAISMVFFLLFGCNMNGDSSLGRNITPIRDRWVLPGGTAEERKHQWVACGGTDIGGYNEDPHPAESVSSNKKIAKEGLDKFDRMQVCMMNAGYLYISSCEGRIPATYPACRDRASKSKQINEIYKK